jgi:hypothetical protein
VAGPARLGFDRLVALIVIPDFVIFLFVGFGVGWIAAGLFAIASLVGLLVLTIMWRARAGRAGTDDVNWP